MVRLQNPNLEILRLTLAKLGELADEFVFVGGCAAGLLITDTAAPPIRATKDVDAIVKVASRAEYYQLSKRLRGRGFHEDSSERAPLCRWLSEPLILDVMPTDETILGFGNPWYAAAIKAAERINLETGESLSLVTSPYFLISKLDAFGNRGKGDFQMSHDMCVFCPIPITDSGFIRSPILEVFDH